MRHPQILNRKQTALLIVDVQTKINAVMLDGESVVENIIKLIEAANTLNL
ncbi:hydrolase, partial [candidate division KSB1 bacterium]|nr:hydrolase [Phycisphaerae bacterium]NIU08581.1 hydrolase [Phycisphaerae bacterium]NIV93978.1 hydrolase [candidate division KSB1 bacterium]NIX28916.1 hydrolase [Phycisphaerae bacterium]